MTLESRHLPLTHFLESYDSNGGHQDEAVRLRLRLVRDYHGGQRTDVQTEDRSTDRGQMYRQQAVRATGGAHCSTDGQGQSSGVQSDCGAQSRAAGRNLIT